MQAATRAAFPLIVRTQILTSLKFLSKIYEQNRQTIANRIVLSRFGRILYFCAKLLLIDYIVVGILAILSPALLYYFANIKEYIAPVWLPGLPLNYCHEYPINMLFQALIVYCGCIYYLYFDILFVVQVLHVILLVEIMRQKVREISTMAINRQRFNAIDIKFNVRNIILMHNELLR